MSWTAGISRVLMIATAVLALTGCDNGRRLPEAAAPSTSVATASPEALTARVGQGLLIARDRGVVLRDMDAGTERPLITAAAGVAYAFPRWSPDGRWIAAVKTTQWAGDLRKPWGDDIVILAADGAGERVAWARPHSGVRIEGIAWSADGTALYTTIFTPGIKDGVFTGVNTLTLERLDLADGFRTLLVEQAGYPAAAPGGQYIAYVTFTGDSKPSGLWLARPDGSEARLLVPIPGRFADLRNLRFSPDGRRVAFAAVEVADANLIARDCFTGRRLPWQPPAARAHGPPFDLWAVSLEGDLVEKLAALSEDDVFLAWSPDGRRLAAIGSCGLYEVEPAAPPPQGIGPGAFQAQIDWR